MIKNLLSSKITTTASGEFAIIGLKLSAEPHVLRMAGIVLAAVSLTVLAIGMVLHAKHETIASKPVGRKHTRKSNRSRTSRAN